MDDSNLLKTSPPADINFLENEKKLQDIFLEGWRQYENLEETQLPFNSKAYQDLVKNAMENFENATRGVSQIEIFSPNELIDEVSTESLQYLLLPFFLGKLALKLQREDRMEVLKIAEIYFNDYLQRCQDYELCELSKNGAEKANITNRQDEPPPANELAELMRAAQSRNDKIAQFRRKKELEEQIKLMKTAVLSKSVDEEVRREFFLNFLKKSIIDTREELDSLKLEKQMVEMRKMHMASGSNAGEVEYSGAANGSQPTSTLGHGHNHGHSHNHDHNQHKHSAPKPKPLQPFIITRNAAQRAVFGAGYPSLPVMTVDEFYHQRVAEGVFPDEEKVKRMNEAQAIAAVQDPNEKEDQEKAIVEEQIENDDPEYLERMRRMDEYKDVVRRGDGNRHNRS